MRKPNTKCHICDNLVYKRPSELNKFEFSYCSRSCYIKHKNSNRIKNCKYCSKEFLSEKKSHTYCSRNCGNTARRGLGYTKNKNSNSSKRNLLKLQEVFDFDSCMVMNCNYNITYDIHRHVEGKDGGKYEIGNMFAICPNHHAEVTRKIITFEKVNNYILKIKEDSAVDKAKHS